MTWASFFLCFPVVPSSSPSSSEEPEKSQGKKKFHIFVVKAAVLSWTARSSLRDVREFKIRASSLHFSSFSKTMRYTAQNIRPREWNMDHRISFVMYPLSENTETGDILFIQHHPPSSSSSFLIPREFIISPSSWLFCDPVIHTFSGNLLVRKERTSRFLWIKVTDDSWQYFDRVILHPHKLVCTVCFPASSDWLPFVNRRSQESISGLKEEAGDTAICLQHSD